MATGKGVIQGYTGVAAVDGAHQIIVEAQAHGTGSEQALLLPVVEALIADNDMRKRDERFRTQERHHHAPDPLHDKSAPASPGDARLRAVPAPRALFPHAGDDDGPQRRVLPRSRRGCSRIDSHHSSIPGTAS